MVVDNLEWLFLSSKLKSFDRYSKVNLSKFFNILDGQFGANFQSILKGFDILNLKF